MYYNNTTQSDFGEDIRQLKRLPQFIGMSEADMQHFIARVTALETQEWINSERQRIKQEREKTLAYIEEKAHSMMLPPEPVKIEMGIRIYPSLIDDKGFVSTESLLNQKKTHKFSLDSKRKIYLS